MENLRYRPIGVGEYNQAEKEALRHTPNRIVEAFQAATVLRFGYPTMVEHESELCKYVDVMHAGRFENFYHDILRGFRLDEFDLWQRLNSKLASFTQQYFGRPMLARGPVLQGFNVLRHIKYLFGDTRPRVLELGPGCGYLGALLMLEGYPYAGSDVTQAFYLYQNHFWNALSDGKVYEGALGGLDRNALASIPAGSAVHVPWWELGRLRPETIPQFDVLTCNHMLGEMHPNSMRFSLLLARACLQGDGSSLKAVVFDRWGHCSPEEEAQIAKTFYEYGFRLVHHDRNIVVLVPAESPHAVGHLPLPTQSIQSSLNFADGQLVQENVAVESWAPIQYQSEANPLSNVILQRWREDDSRRTIGIEQLNSVITAMLGSSKHMSEDEEFLSMINQVGLL